MRRGHQFVQHLNDTDSHPKGDPRIYRSSRHSVHGKEHALLGKSRANTLLMPHGFIPRAGIIEILADFRAYARKSSWRKAMREHIFCTIRLVHRPNRSACDHPHPHFQSFARGFRGKPFQRRPPIYPPAAPIHGMGHGRF